VNGPAAHIEQLLKLPARVMHCTTPIELPVVHAGNSKTFQCAAVLSTTQKILGTTNEMLFLFNPAAFF